MWTNLVCFLDLSVSFLWKNKFSSCCGAVCVSVVCWWTGGVSLRQSAEIRVSCLLCLKAIHASFPVVSQLLFCLCRNVGISHLQRKHRDAFKWRERSVIKMSESLTQYAHFSLLFIHISKALVWTTALWGLKEFQWIGLGSNSCFPWAVAKQRWVTSSRLVTEKWKQEKQTFGEKSGRIFLHAHTCVCVSECGWECVHFPARAVWTHACEICRKVKLCSERIRCSKILWNMLS